MAIDRDSEDVAKAALQAMIPKKADRVAVLTLLLHSFDRAERAAPNASAVTLTTAYVRLNVGSVEVMAVTADVFFINCSALCGSPPFDSEQFEAAAYRSVPQPQCRFWGAHKQAAGLDPAALQAHARFVEMAARAPSGKPIKGTRFAKSHSPGLLAYSRRATSVPAATSGGAA